MINRFSTDLADKSYDVCVIGAGPVGITLALHLGRLGRSVLLLESGDTEPKPEIQSLAEAELVGSHHVPMALAVQRRLGGASNLWGGRCVPLDPIDFERRNVTDAAWPIPHAEIMRHIPQACHYAGCGQPVFTSENPVPVQDDAFSLNSLERWSTRPRFRNAHRQELRDSRSVDLRLRSVATGFGFAEDGRVISVIIRSPAGDSVTVAPKATVLAAGGLENARLLLAAQMEQPQRFGGESGPLGRYYMGHVYGAVAEVTWHSDTLDKGMNYYDDGLGCYVRRRFKASAETQRAANLANASLWPEFPSIHDPAHGSGVLSFAYLALSLPPVGRMIVAESVRRAYLGKNSIARVPHLLNVVRDFPRTASFVPGFVYRRYLARRTMPGFFQRNAGRRYALRYHAEHLPNPASRVVLSGQKDTTGLPMLRINLHYGREDAEALLRTHRAFETWLHNTGLGSFRYMVPPEERADHILAQCYDGHHQIGLTRMAASASQGVVDLDCLVFGTRNLFVAGSSVFPTSGQANPTLTAIGLAVRLAEHLAPQF